MAMKEMERVGTHEIPRSRWEEFFEQFSEEHEGWVATLETVDDNLGHQIEVRAAGLAGISLDRKGSEPGDVEIHLGLGAADHVTHRVESPARVYYHNAVDANSEAVEIESEGGRKTLVRFAAGSAPALPS